MSTLHILAARGLVEQVKLIRPVAVLSIEHPGVARDDDGRAPRLHAEHGVKNIFQYIQSYYDTETPHPLAPSREHVSDGLHFLLHHAMNGPVVVHCRQGKSRSVAMGLAFLAATHPDIKPCYLIEHIRKIRTVAAPNILMIEHADEILGLKGALLKAVLADEGLTAAREAANAGRAVWAEKNPGWAKPATGPK